MENNKRSQRKWGRCLISMDITGMAYGEEEEGDHGDNGGKGNDRRRHRHHRLPSAGSASGLIAVQSPILTTGRLAPARPEEGISECMTCRHRMASMVLYDHCFSKGANLSEIPKF